MRTKIAIFCSGSGSNAQKIMEYFQGNEAIEVAVLMANKPGVFALERAAQFNIPSWVFTKEDFAHSDNVLLELKRRGIDWIILAGFLWLIPENLVKNFPHKILNIHPALLPKFGGKGMYGSNVHKAVVENKERESGMSIHYVNAHYDEGNIIFQASCPIESTDSPEDVAKKVLVLEHKHYPEVIEKTILNHK